jgi:hypothetical protein
MLLSTAEDLAKFVEELKRESDRGLALVSAALIDDKLGETLRSFFFKGPSAAKLLGLKSNLPEGAGWPINDPRFRFMNAAVAIVLRIYHRPEWVALEQRQPKSWLPISASKWRMFEKEKPPPGVPVMLMGVTGPVVGVEQLPSKPSGTE